MSAYRRNILVGAVVLGAILVFGWMVLRFSGKTAELFAPPQMTIHFQSSRADGLADGSAVQFLGVNVGRVTAVKRLRDVAGVSIDALVDRNPPLPANLRALIAQSNPLGSSSTINLDIDGSAPQGELQAETKLPASYVGLQLNLLPPAFAATAQQIGQMSAEIERTMRELRESGVTTDLDAAIRQVNTQTAKLGQMMDSIQAIVGDPQSRQNIQEIIADFHQTAATAARISTNLEKTTHSLQRNRDDASAAIKSTQQHIDQISKKMIGAVAQVSVVMQSVNDITEKINQGKGTAGLLVNDPQLYLAMVDTAKKLDETVGDLKRVIDQWEQEGVSLKLK